MEGDSVVAAREVGHHREREDQPMRSATIVRRTATALLTAAALLTASTGQAPAAERQGRVDDTLCQVEDGAQICQTVTGVYTLTETPSGRTILTVHLDQVEEITTADGTLRTTLEIDDQYVYDEGEPVVVVSHRLQQREEDGEVTTCTEFGRLVFANGDVRLEAATTPCA
jgi:hypothetical protein